MRLWIICGRDDGPSGNATETQAASPSDQNGHPGKVSFEIVAANGLGRIPKSGNRFSGKNARQNRKLERLSGSARTKIALARRAPSEYRDDQDKHHNCRDKRHAGFVERRLLRPPLNEFHRNLLLISMLRLKANPGYMGLPYRNAQDDAMTAPGDPG